MHHLNEVELQFSMRQFELIFEMQQNLSVNFLNIVFFFP